MEECNARFARCRALIFRSYVRCYRVARRGMPQCPSTDSLEGIINSIMGLMDQCEAGNHDHDALMVR
ncbi:unnamed protein product [Caenorhabditis bovis]|uniref:Uncharacterized protein n=1 Tax=Caenorhabditis bovis TaxID=2654633 RepID=A0A8S1FC11_9PELO|nr:unnamed protein product [Caenorhabditis bovis]